LSSSVFLFGIFVLWLYWPRRGARGCGASWERMDADLIFSRIFAPRSQKRVSILPLLAAPNGQYCVADIFIKNIYGDVKLIINFVI